METRESAILLLRPEILSAKVTPNMSKDESFQNKTIRPIVILQSALLLEVFKNYIRKHKSVFYEYSIEKRLDYIEHAIQRDIKFRNSLKGIIIGQFTVEEYLLYIENSSDLNKRMMNIVIERIKSNIQLLEIEYAL